MAGLHVAVDDCDIGVAGVSLDPVPLIPFCILIKLELIEDKDLICSRTKIFTAGTMHNF